MGREDGDGRQRSLHVLCCFPDVLSGKPAKSRGGTGLATVGEHAGEIEEDGKNQCPK